MGQQAVAPLPGPQELGGDARAPGELADPQLGFGAHFPTVQALDKI